jgi:hypothetical protein
MSDELVRLTVVSSEFEAEALRGLLSEEGISSMQRPTDFAVGSLDGWSSAGGLREILVHAADLERARELVPTD